MRKNVFQCRITTLVDCIAMLMQLAAIVAAEVGAEGRATGNKGGRESRL